MIPQLLESIPEYPVFLLAAAFGGCGLTLWQARREGWQLGRLVLLLAVTVLASLFGAKLFGITERGGGFHGFAWELTNGFRYAGGIAGAFVVMPFAAAWLLPNFSLARLGDMSAASTALALALMRVGCLIAGCCSGTPSTLPWAIRYPPHSAPWDAHLAAGLIDADAASSAAVHPLQVYFGVTSLALAVFLLCYRSRQRYAGQVLLIFLVMDGTTKLLLEFLRFDYAPHLQWAALAQVSLAAAVLGAKALRDRQPVERLA